VDPVEHRQAVDARQPQIENDEVELLAGELRERFLSRVRDARLVPLVFENLRQRRADRAFVVDDQNLRHRSPFAVRRLP